MGCFLSESPNLETAVLSRFETRYQIISDVFTQKWEKTQ